MNGDRSELEPRRRGFSLPVRRGRGRLVAGVCTGLSERWAIDVTLVRLVFVVLGLAWGLGVLGYVALWVLMPDASASAPATDIKHIVRRNARRMGGEVRVVGQRLEAAWARTRPTRPITALDRSMIAVGIVAVGVLLLLISIGAFAWITPVRLLGVAAVVAGIGVLLTLHGRR